MNKLRLNETIDLSTGSVQGIFSFISQLNLFSWLTTDIAQNLDNTFYLVKYGERVVTSSFLKLYNKYESSPSENTNPLTIYANMISQIYKVKWTSLYNALENTSYDLLNNKNLTHTITKNGNNVETPDITKSRDLEKGQKITTTDISEDSNESKTSTNIQTTSNDTTNNQAYGFQSVTPVNTDLSTNDSTSVESGSADDNVTSETSTKNRTNTIEALPSDNTESETETETGTREHNYNETTTDEMVGYDVAPQDTIMKEIELRKINFYDIIMYDAASFMTLSVY